MSETVDVVIIGAGTAGLSALREVRKQTENFLIVNDGPYGTTCARVGCMPSKALIEAANAFHRRTAFAELGIEGAEGLSVDVPAVLERVRRLRDDFVAGTERITDELDERNLPGRARFVAPDTLDVDGQRIRARTIIVATGSRPIVPPHWEELGPRLLTTDTLFEQRTLPATMAVVGLGAIGVEIAQALARLGIRITAFGSSTPIAGIGDPAIHEQAEKVLSQEFTMHRGARAEATLDVDEVCVRAGDREVRVGAVLAAMGRRPNIDDLGLDQLGVPLDEHGMPPLDRATLQIGDLPVYLVGDANEGLEIMHEAGDEGYISGFNSLARSATRFLRRTPMYIVFADPNIVRVGRSYADLEPAQVAIGEVDFEHQGRARVAAIARGKLRLYANRQDGRLLGAEMMAPHGEHLAHLLGLAMSQKLTVHDCLRMPFYHPVLEEGLRTALRDASRQLHEPSRSDLASCDPVGAEALD
jgi:dihydrolipoamide dehydrogenase